MVALTNRTCLTIAVASLLGISTLEACAPAPPIEVQGCEAIREAYLPGREIANFDSAHIATQYKIFICARLYVRPPIVEVDRELALLGEPAAHFLAERFADTEDDRVLNAILKVFDRMSDLGTYDVVKDIALMTLVREKISNMRSATLRQSSEQLLRNIERRGATSPNREEDLEAPAQD